MIESKERIARLNGQVLLVAYDTLELLRTKLIRDLEIPYPILLDPRKETYRRWGLGRTTLGESVFSPGLTARYLGLLLRGERFLGLAPDMLQLGGDFVVDREGKIAVGHAMRDNGDRLPVHKLIETMEQVAHESGPTV